MKRILIIEDNTGQQEVYKYWFSDHSLDFCEKISDALRLVQTKDYDIILLDLHLGESESGFSFLDNFELKDGKPKVIVVSAYLSSLAEGLVPLRGAMQCSHCTPSALITPRKEPVMKENKDIVWLDKEEATQEVLMEEMELKEA